MSTYYVPGTAGGVGGVAATWTQSCARGAPGLEFRLHRLGISSSDCNWETAEEEKGSGSHLAASLLALGKPRHCLPAFHLQIEEEGLAVLK